MFNYTLLIYIYWIFNQLIQTVFNLQQFIELLTTSKFIISILYLKLGLLYFKHFGRLYIFFTLLIVKADFMFLNNFYINISRLNIGLFNSIVISHPMLLLLLLILILYTLLRFNMCTKVLLCLTFISAVTTFLGSFWSSQEVFWEGFWNWDFIEITIVLLLYCYFMLSHNNRNKYNSNLLVMSVLVFIKVGSSTPFMSSIHSFSGNPLYNISYFYLTVLFFIYLLFFKITYDGVVSSLTIIYVVTNYSKDLMYVKSMEYTINYIVSYIIYKYISTFSEQTFKVFYIFLKQRYIIAHFNIILILYTYLKFFSLTNCMVKLLQLDTLSIFSREQSVSFPLREVISYNINIFFNKPSTGLYTYNKPTIDYLYCIIS